MLFWPNNRNNDQVENMRIDGNLKLHNYIWFVFGVKISNDNFKKRDLWKIYIVLNWKIRINSSKE